MPYWDTTAPCQAHPADYLQPGEDPLWHLGYPAQRALETCATCPHTRACAARALTAGTTKDRGTVIEACADGAIYAGIVCRGDMTTRRQLHQIVNPASGASHCAACNRPFRTLSAVTDAVTERKDGLCRGCYKAAKRTGRGVAATPRDTPPPACVDCTAPMVPWGQPRPAGHVNHDSGGRCKRCAKMRARRLAAA